MGTPMTRSPAQPQLAGCRGHPQALRGYIHLAATNLERQVLESGQRSRIDTQEDARGGLFGAPRGVRQRGGMVRSRSIRPRVTTIARVEAPARRRRADFDAAWAEGAACPREEIDLSSSAAAANARARQPEVGRP